MKRLLSLVLALTLVAAAGCGELGIGPSNSFGGTYRLNTVDNSFLPATLYYRSINDRMEVLSAELYLDRDGRYEGFTRVRDTFNGTTVVYDEETRGEWSATGSDVTLRNDFDGRRSYARGSSGRLTFDDFGGYGVRAEYVR